MDRDHPLEPKPDRPRKGRGALGNPTGRFERELRLAVSDGWEIVMGEDEAPRISTTLTPDRSRTIIA